jgi:hypothetical protein
MKFQRNPAKPEQPSEPPGHVETPKKIRSDRRPRRYERIFLSATAAAATPEEMRPVGKQGLRFPLARFTVKQVGSVSDQRGQRAFADRRQRFTNHVLHRTADLTAVCAALRRGRITDNEKHHQRDHRYGQIRPLSRHEFHQHSVV